MEQKPRDGALVPACLPSPASQTDGKRRRSCDADHSPMTNQILSLGLAKRVGKTSSPWVVHLLSIEMSLSLSCPSMGLVKVPEAAKKWQQLASATASNLQQKAHARPSIPIFSRNESPAISRVSSALSALPLDAGWFLIQRTTTTAGSEHEPFRPDTLAVPFLAGETALLLLRPRREEPERPRVMD
ncbi:hypothetical protein NL676_003672 [Syzygium grande]|nr:hypothetical protein NL676_003672 [Syzygium grande]